jgi:hypothetical protein
LLGNTTVVARVLEVEENSDPKAIIIRGNTGLVEGKILRVVATGDLLEQLIAKVDNMVELGLDYEPEYETKTENVI